MADTDQIRQAMDSLGALYAAEHHEGDDQGVRQVENLVRLLKKFAKHEDQEHAAMMSGDQKAVRKVQSVREGVYHLHDGRSVYYDNGRETLQDAADLYTVLNEEHKTGSPNLENGQARIILDRLQAGGGLGEMHIGTLRRLLTKHAGAVARLRKSRDRDGQNPLDTASDGPDSRIINQTR